ncbi:penicillin-binding transpeptidase domain-containing protein [Vibrio sp. M60_M31a]
MIGSRQPNFHGFNRAINAERQIGSLIKPAVYVTALAQPERYALGTNLADQPITIQTQNNEKLVTKKLRSPVSRSGEPLSGPSPLYNVPTVNLGMAIGLDKVTNTLVSLGVKETQVPQVPSMLLGALALSPLNVTQMYQALGNQGEKQNLFALSAVLDEHGQQLYRHQAQQEKVLEPEAAWLIEYAMEQVVEQGTARYLNQIVRSQCSPRG